MSDADRPLRMLTFAPMINSECGRLVFRHYGEAWDERNHLIGLANLLALLRGGYGALPFTYGPGIRLSNILPLVDHFDALHPDRRLRPPTQPLRQQIDADWSRFNVELGGNIVVVAYYYLLPLSTEMKKVFAVPIPGIERLILSPYYWALNAVFTWLLTLKEPRVADTVLRVRLMLDQVDARLADGRTWLGGGKERTLADIALASTIAPLVIPPAYSPQVPPEDVLPQPFLDLVAETRARPCAAHLHRLYAELAP